MVRAWSGERCDPLARSGSGPAAGHRRGLWTEGPGWRGRRAGGGPELRGASAGRDLGGGDAAGGVQGVEGVVDLAGGLVVVEGLVDLAAGQPARMGSEGGVDLLGEWIAGRAGEAHAADRAAYCWSASAAWRCVAPIWRWPSVRV